jgi:hypothetical protein
MEDIAPPTPREQALQLAQGLRELADVFEMHGGKMLPLPKYGVQVGIDVTQHEDNDRPYGSPIDEEATRKVLKKAIRGMGSGRKEKIFNDWQFLAKREFAGGVTLKVSTTREGVCKKVLTGNKIIHAARTDYIPETVEEEFEWVCDDPILKDIEPKFKPEAAS